MKWARSVVMLGLLGFLVYAVYAWLNMPEPEPPREADIQQVAQEPFAPPQVDMGQLQPPGRGDNSTPSPPAALPEGQGPGPSALPVPEQSDQSGTEQPPVQAPLENNSSPSGSQDPSSQQPKEAPSQPKPTAAPAVRTAEEDGPSVSQNSPAPADTRHDPEVVQAQVEQGVSLATDSTDPQQAYLQAVQEAAQLLQSNQLADALLVLSRWYGHPKLSPEQHEQLNRLLDQLAGTVIYSRQHWLEEAYVVQPGETLEQIAHKYRVPWKLLAKINGILPPYQLQPGEKLKVVRGPFDAEVDLTRMTLTLFVDGGRYAGRFAVGVGTDIPPQPGEYVVLSKVENPSYRLPNQQILPGGDPNNPLGKFLIQLSGQLAIHGTNDPQSVGRTGGPGCIRLGHRDIEDVFDILSVGSKVVIRR